MQDEKKRRIQCTLFHLMVKGTPGMFRLATLVGLLLLSSVAGCATSEENPSGPEACVVVDNTEGAGAQERIFLVSESLGWRLGIGRAGMGRSVEFCTGRIRGAERVYILIEQPALGESNPSLFRTREGFIRSQTFALHNDEIWTWDISRNELFRAVRF